MSDYSKRHAFSLIELLVVIGIIALLMAMLLPAIQRVRETSNKVLCGNNLRQLGIAAHHFHSDYSRLPPGYLGPSIKNQAMLPQLFSEGQWAGHLALLTPYLEQDKLFTRFNVKWGLDDISSLLWCWRNALQDPEVENYLIGMTRLQVLRCPSGADYNPTVGDSSLGGGGSILGIHVFHDSTSVQTVYWKGDYIKASQFQFLAKTNYFGVAGTGSGNQLPWSKWQGIYTNRSKVTLGSITTADGTSNTLLYGEASLSANLDICWVGGGALGTYQGLKGSSRANVTQFSGFHTPGVQFCFADGTVRTVSFKQTSWNGSTVGNSTAWTTLQQLAGWRDGERVDPSLLED